MTAYNWKHNYIPINVQTALLHKKKKWADKLHKQGASHAHPEPKWWHQKNPSAKKTLAATSLGKLDDSGGPSQQVKQAKKSGKHVIQAPVGKFTDGQTIYARLPDGSIGKVKIAGKGKEFGSTAGGTKPQQQYHYTVLEKVTKRSELNKLEQKKKAIAASIGQAEQGPSAPKPLPADVAAVKSGKGEKLDQLTLHTARELAADSKTTAYVFPSGMTSSGWGVSPKKPTVKDAIAIEPDGSMSLHKVAPKPVTPAAGDLSEAGPGAPLVNGYGNKPPQGVANGLSSAAVDQQTSKFYVANGSTFSTTDKKPAAGTAYWEATPDGKVTEHKTDGSTKTILEPPKPDQTKAADDLTALISDIDQTAASDKLAATIAAAKSGPKLSANKKFPAQQQAAAFQKAVTTGKTHYLPQPSGSVTTTKPNGPHGEFRADGSVWNVPASGAATKFDQAKVADVITKQLDKKKAQPGAASSTPSAPSAPAASSSDQTPGMPSTPAAPSTPEPPAPKPAPLPTPASAPSGTPVDSAQHKKLAAAKVVASKGGNPVYLTSDDSAHMYVGKPPGGADWIKVKPDGSLEKGSSKEPGPGVDVTPDVAPAVKKSAKSPDPKSGEMVDKAELATNPVQASPQYLSENAAQALQKAVATDTPHYVTGSGSSWSVTDTAPAPGQLHYQLRPDGTEWVINADGSAAQVDPKTVDKHLSPQLQKATPGQAGAYTGMGPSDQGYVTSTTVAQMAKNLPDFDDVDVATGLQIAGHYKNTVSTGNLSAMQSYTGSGYGSLNLWLRTGNGETPHLKKQVQDLDALMGKYQLPAAMVVTRGIGDEHFPKGPFVPGTTFTDHGYISTSYGKPFGGAIKFTFTLPKGMNAISVDGAGGGAIGTGAEKEIILPRGTRFVVESDKTVGGVRQISAVALPPADTSLPTAQKFAGGVDSVVEAAPAA